MALLSRPLTENEAIAIAASLGRPYIFRSPFLEALMEPRYQYVRYDARLDRTVYEAKDTFYWTNDESPSDSRWMVPGIVL